MMLQTMERIGQCGELNFKHRIHRLKSLEKMMKKCRALMLPVFGGSPGPKRMGYLALWDAE